jgi:YebC/PmpR family DNA-binding regulatory protein
MSGHSHWAGIKHDKGIADAKRGMAFSKLARMISIAAKKGKGPSTNSALRVAIEKAREINMPTENIERAIKRGTGELEGAKLEEVIFEAYGPGNTAIIIEGITDNKNRTLNEIKKILGQSGGKLAAAGSVQWLFERKGVITVSMVANQEKITKENLELKAIENGAEDINWKDDFLNIFTKTEILEKVKKSLEDQGLKIESASLDWTPKNLINTDEKNRLACQKLFEALDENEDIQEIYSNLPS